MNKNNDENSGESDQQSSWGWGGRSQFGFGHQGFARAQFGQRGWLRPAILKLLEDKPMNGMEIINKFSEYSHGWWKPSPGSVYPLLEALETEGLIEKTNDGRYKTTAKFNKERAPRGEVDEMLTNLEGTASYLEELSQSDKKQFASYKERIAKVAKRLSKL